MTSVDTETVKAAVRETYGRIASEAANLGLLRHLGLLRPGRAAEFERPRLFR